MNAAGTICFVARQDFVTKPGGDTVQWQMYDRAAQAAGWRTVAWFDDKPRPPADVYHAFNIDRPLELYPKLRQAREAGRPFVLSTIHHPNPWLEKFRTLHPPGGRMGALFYRSPVGRSVAAGESVKELARLIRQGRFGHLADLVPGWSSRVRWLLREASAVTLLAGAERPWLERDFGVAIEPARAVVLPNWVEGISAVAGPVDVEAARDAILVVARIEARKNVLQTARWLESAGLKTLFLGRPNPNEPDYAREFEQVVGGARHVRWVPGVPRETLAGFYGVGRTLLNASYVEVSPLVDIEALAQGCPVITTRYALHHELLPAGTPQVDPYHEASVIAAVRQPTARRAPKLVTDPGACREILLRCYAAIR